MCTLHASKPSNENANATPQCRRNLDLCLDLVFPSEHLVNVRQIVCARYERLDLTDGAEVFLQVGLLS